MCSNIWSKYEELKEIKDKILQTNSGFQVNNSTQLAEKIILLLRNRSLIKRQLTILRI